MGAINFVNGTQVDVTEYDGRPQDQLPVESDVSYYWFLIFISDMHSTISSMAIEADRQKKQYEEEGKIKFVPSRHTLTAWNQNHDWRRRRAVYNKIQMEFIKDRIDEVRQEELNVFFGKDDK